LTNLLTYPSVAACAGKWSGDVSTAAPLCGSGWHVCIGGDGALATITFADATAFAGCFAINAALDDSTCHPGSCTDSVNAGVDDEKNIDMGGVGNDCSFKFPGDTSCITGGRIDASENSGTGCAYTSGLSGVVCCKNGS
jgi:hypothetical protein